MYLLALSAGYLLALIATAALLLMASDRLERAIWRRRNPPEKVAAQRQLLLRRLQAPDWQFYADHLQRSVPEALQAWYASPDTLARYYYFGDNYVAFLPIDRTATADAGAPPGVVPFADSDGDLIFLKPGVDADDAVLITYHDGGGTETLAPSVHEFLAGLRVAA